MGNQRKRKFIHVGIQGKLIGRMIAQWLIFIGAMAGTTLLVQLILDPLQSPEEWNRQTQLTLISFPLVAIALLPIFMWDTVKFSHRFVGPVVRLESHIQNLLKGRDQTLAFRDDDYWQDLAVQMNTLVARLREQTPKSQEEADLVLTERN